MPQVRSNRICFTLNNYTVEDCEELIATVEREEDKISYFVCGEEIGKNGTPHLQGYCHVKEKEPRGIRWWKGFLRMDKMHVEAAKGSDVHSQAYCTKDGPFYELGVPTDEVGAGKHKEIYETARTDLDAAIALDYEFGIKHHAALERIYNRANEGKCDLADRKLDVLLPWQEHVMRLLTVQNERQILFVVDQKGGAGKTVLGDHIRSVYPSWKCQGGANKDLMTAYKTGAEMCILDMARCNDVNWWPWNFMENVKNGSFTSVKYKGRENDFKRPKVIVFSNVEIPRDKLSADRYQVININTQ